MNELLIEEFIREKYGTKKRRDMINYLCKILQIYILTFPSNTLSEKEKNH